MKRTMRLYVTCVVEVTVPDDSPLTPSTLVKAAEFRDHWSDGRWPFEAELVHAGAADLARHAAATAIGWHFHEAFGRPTHADNIAGRNAAEAAAFGKVRVTVPGDQPIRYRAERT